MKQKRQGGSVPGFTVVAVILVGLLIAGAYFIQQQGRNKPSTTPVEMPGQAGGNEQKPAEESTTPPPTSSAPQSSSNPQPQASQSSSHLPQSGPADTFVTLLAVTLLTGAGVSYIQSRRRLAPL